MTTPLWTSAEITAATGGTTTGLWAVDGISIDSRSVKAGDLFIAIKGDKHDGHDHILNALAQGATGVILSTRPANLPTDAPVVEVANTDKALIDLAKAARARASAKIIAITGSVGKTSAKEMLTQIAQKAGKTHATLGNLNNHIGLPLTLARLPRDAAYGVFEVGMNHAEEIRPLSLLLQPHAALITTLGTAHIQNFATGAEGIADAKAEIFSGLMPHGVAIIPADAPLAARLITAAQQAHATLVTFGENNAEARLTNITLHAETVDVSAHLAGTLYHYTLPVAGAHMAMNSLACLAAATHAFGIAPAVAVEALTHFTPLKGRGLRKVFGGVTVIDESYNASPLSMQASIAVLGQATGRHIAVLGDMLELGDCAPAEHAGLLPYLQAAQVDKVYCCGSLMQHLWQSLPPALQGAWAPSAADLAPLVANAVKAGDAVLVKGSRGQQVNIKGVMSPSMAQIIATIEETHSSVLAEKGLNHVA